MRLHCKGNINYPITRIHTPKNLNTSFMHSARSEHLFYVSIPLNSLSKLNFKGRWTSNCFVLNYKRKWIKIKTRHTCLLDDPLPINLIGWCIGFMVIPLAVVFKKFLFYQATNDLKFVSLCVFFLLFLQSSGGVQHQVLASESYLGASHLKLSLTAN